MGFNRNRIDIFEFVANLVAGDELSWLTLGAIALLLGGAALYHHLNGSKFPDKKARREARRKRGKVIWEYERD